MAQPYQHAPLESLDSIRLLDLLPALKWDAPVECRIRQLTLEKACDKYEALSYVWGAREGDRPITCDGCELLITPNCRDALIHLRRRFRVRTLWIDSICIDQRKTPDSTQERNHQVKQMGVVYQNASRVLVWLGMNTSGLTVNHHNLLKLVYYGGRYKMPLEMWLATNMQLDKRLSYFRPILASPWFVRIWTIQVSQFLSTPNPPVDKLEKTPYRFSTIFTDNSGMVADTSKEFAFAKKCTLIWGRLKFKWGYIHDLAEYLWLSQGTYNQAMPLRNFAAASIQKSPYRRRDSDAEAVSSPAELRFVLSLRFQQSTLNHDKVYGVYAVLTTMGIKIPEPDYNKPTESVMEEFTWAYISSRKHLDLITAEIPGNNAPTWIPEYITSPEMPFNKFGTYFRGRTEEDLRYLHRASGRSKAFMAHEKLPGKLVVKGKFVDFVQSSTVCQTIRTTHQNPFDFQSFRDVITVCQYWCQTCTELLQRPEETVYRNSESLWKAVLGSIRPRVIRNTVFADWIDLMLYPNCSRISPAEVINCSRPSNMTEAEYQPLHADVILGYLTHLWESWEREYDSVGELDSTIFDMQVAANELVNWAFLITGNGYLGRAYRTCQKGDQLWLLAGSANPVLLRQSGSEYQYIAPARFHGMMEGELWPEDETELKTITLV